MLEGLVAWVLNNYLGKYVENLNTDQLSVALLSGKVELENLPLRKDALRHLGLPVEIKAGFIGKVQLQVPVRQIRSAPWLIAIEKLYLVAAPVNLDEWDSAAEASIAHERKVAILDALEAQWRSEFESADTAGYYATSYSSWLTYGTGLLANIVENLQLKLNDVHIRYEDSITSSLPFACGLTAESLCAESCDSEWRRGFTLLTDPEGCSFKLLELQRLAVYWDPMPVPAGMFANHSIPELTECMSETWRLPHRYIVRPACARARVRRERTEQPLRSRTRPRLAAHLTLDTVTLNLSSRQYREAVGCALGLERLARVREVRALRPARAVRADPRAWWLYALSCHVPVHRWTEPRPTWQSCLESGRCAREYVAACLLTLSNPAATLPPERKAAKDEYEWRTPLHLLQALRQVAMRKVPKSTPASTPDQPPSSGRSMLVHWFPQWMGWYGTPSQESAASTPSAASTTAPTTPTSTQMPSTSTPADLEEEILDVIADSLDNNTMLKRDTVFGKFEFILNKGSLNLYMESEEDNKCGEGSEGSGAAGLELQFSCVRLGVESRPRAASHALHVSLGSVCLRERITPNTLFPILIAPQGVIREGLSSLSAGGAAMSWCRAHAHAHSPHAPPPPPPPPPGAASEPLFQLTYEKKPFGMNCDYKLWVKSAPLEVVYNAAAVRWVQQWVSAPWAQAYAHVRDSTRARLRTHWAHMVYTHAHPHPGERGSWQVELDISAPQLLFCEQLCWRDSAVLVVDFGRLRLANAHPHPPHHAHHPHHTPPDDGEMFMTPCSTPPGSLLSPSSPPAPHPAPDQPPLDPDNLHNRLYDRYKIELSDLQILVGRARDNWKYAHTKSTSSLHLLDRFSILLQAERRVVATHDPQYPAATVRGSLPALVAHLSEHKLFAVRAVLAQLHASTAAQAPADEPTEPEPASPSAGGAEDEADSMASPDVSAALALQHNSTLFMMQFAIEQMSLEVQSLGRSIAEVQVCGVRAALTVRPRDVSVSLSVHSLLLVDALQTYGPDFELLVASHKHVGMDTMSGSIRGSEPTSPTSPTSPAYPPSPDARGPPALAHPHALHHALNSLHTATTSAKCMEEGGSPSWVSGTGYNWNGSSMFGPGWGGAWAAAWGGAVWGAPGLVDSEALIAVELCLVKGGHASEDLRIANILFNNLDIIANQETIVELLGFTQRVLAPKASAKQPAGEAGVEEPITTSTYSYTLPEDEPKRDVRTEITFDFHRLGVLLLRAAMHEGTVVARKIATATVTEAKIQATVDGRRVEVGGSLGGVQVVSLCEGGGLHSRVLSAGRLPPAPPHPAPAPALNAPDDDDDEKALLFTIHRNVAGDPDAPVVEAAVSLHVASVWYTHSGPLLHELRSCLTEFKQCLANLARSIRAAAADMAIGLVHPRGETLYVNPKLSQSAEGVSPRRRTVSTGASLDEPADLKADNIVLSVNIELESPVVVLPRNAHSSEVLVAHLGRMSLANRPGPPRHTLYRVRVRDIALSTLDVADKLSGSVQQLSDNMADMYDVSAGKPVLHNTALKFSVNYCDSDTDSQADYQCEVEGKIVGGLQVSARREQYEQLLETLRWISSDPDTDVADGADVADTHAQGGAELECACAGAVPTLRLDPAVRAATLSAAPAAAHPPPRPTADVAAVPPLTVKFELPTFSVELRADLGEGERSLVELSFREFKLQYHKAHPHENMLQVSLHSITMEDLTKEPDSKHRMLMVSHTPQVPPKAVFLSKSCPDLLASYAHVAPGPHSLTQMKHCSSSLPSQLHVAANPGATRTNKRDNKCGATPPCSPEPRTGGAATPPPAPEPDDHLVRLSVHTRDPQHPHFSDHYNKISKLTKIDFNCLNLVVSIDSWVAVLDFFGVAGDDAPDADAGLEQPVTTGGGGGGEGVSQTELWVRSLSAVLVRGGGEVCRALVSRVHTVARADPATHTRAVAGRLGALALTDLTPHAPLWRERLRTHADHALTFDYRRLSSAEAATAGHETSLHIEMGPVTYVHTKRFVQELQAFARDFSLLRRVILQARLKVSVVGGSADGSEAGDGRAARMQLRLRSSAPVIVLPVSGRSRAALAAHLDQLHLDNCFKRAGDPGTVSAPPPNDEPGAPLDVRSARLAGVALWCARGGRGLRVRRLGPPLLHAPAHLDLHIEYNMGDTHTVADMTVHGSLSTLQAALDPAQYRLVRGVLAHNLADPALDAPPPPAFFHDHPQDQVWTTSSLKLELLDVTVRLEPQHGVSSLACINFIKSRLHIESYSDLSQDIDLVSQEILVSDTRFAKEPANRRGNVFSNIVQPMQEQRHSVQAEVHARSRPDSSAYTILVNNMRLMAILDWWEAANQFIMQPPHPSADPDQIHLEEALLAAVRAAPAQAPPAREAGVELKLNVTDSQLVLVEEPSVWDTNAVILRSTTVLTYRNRSEKPVSCELNELEVFSCVLGLEEETALSIVEPAALHVALDATRTLHVAMSTLNLRLSYHDMRMFAAMLQSLPVQARAALSGKEASQECEPDAPANSFHMRAHAGATAGGGSGGGWAIRPLWLRGPAPPPPPPPAPPPNASIWPLRAVQVSADCITLCVIDDCLDSDVPLLEVSLSDLQVEQDLRCVEESFSDPMLVSTPAGGAAGALRGGGGAGGGRLAASLAVDYYNRPLSGWEPVVEPWRFETSWEYTLSSELSRGRVQLEVSSAEVLNTNVTSSLVELCQLVRANWTADYYAPQGGSGGGVGGGVEQSPKGSPAGHRRRSPFVPYALRNHTGHKLCFTTLSTTPTVLSEQQSWPGPDDSWMVVRAGDTEPFSFGARRGRRRGRAPAPSPAHAAAPAPAPAPAALHQLALRLDGWAAPDPVCVDRVGVYFRTLTHAKSGGSARLVFEVSLEGSARKLVTVRSALQLVNRLPHPVEVKVDQAPYGIGEWRSKSGAVRCAQVAAGATWSAPLSAHAAALWTRPLVRGAVAAPAPAPAPVDWRQPSERLLLHHDCSVPPDHVYRFCSVIVRERFPPDRGTPIAGHTITLVPALRLENLLPMELQFRATAASPGPNGVGVAGNISPGDVRPFHEVNVEEGVELSVKLEGFGWSTPLSVCGAVASGSAAVGGSGHGSFSARLKLRDSRARRLYLNARVTIKKTDGIKVSVSAAYWLVNRTGLPLVFRAEGSSAEAAGQFAEHELARMVQPLLFSFAEADGGPTLSARLGSGLPGQPEWCSPFGLGVGVSVKKLEVRGETDGGERVYLVGVGVRAGRGRYRHTNIATLTPRYQLHNNTRHHLQFAQRCCATTLNDPGAVVWHVSAVAGCYLPWHWARVEREQLLCVRVLAPGGPGPGPGPAPLTAWSGGFRVDSPRTLHLACRESGGGYQLIRAEVVCQGATMFVVLTDADCAPPPLRIDNHSPVSIMFHQVGCGEECVVGAHGRARWALPEPEGAAALALRAPGGPRTQLALDALPATHQLLYQNFIYVAFTATHASREGVAAGGAAGGAGGAGGAGAAGDDGVLVLEVPLGSARVVLGRKRYGDRSQLWRRGPNDQLIHEGSSPPQPTDALLSDDAPLSPHAMVLDIEDAAPRPARASALCLRRADPRRASTQAWRLLPPGRMACAHSNLCVQPDGLSLMALTAGTRVVLGLPARGAGAGGAPPPEQAVSWHTLRPGSGRLEVTLSADGPTRLVNIHDLKAPESGWIEGGEEEEETGGADGGGGAGAGGAWREWGARVALAGLSVSLVSRAPPAELVHALFERARLELALGPAQLALALSVDHMQWDNQLLGTPSPVLLYCLPARGGAGAGGGAGGALPALHASLELQAAPTRRYNAYFFRHLVVALRPLAIRLEERLILQLWAWAMAWRGEVEPNEQPDEADYETRRMLAELTALHAARYYFALIKVIPSQIRLSMCTANKLEGSLSALKRRLQLTFIKFEDATVELEPFVRAHVFDTASYLGRQMLQHFKDELKWQAAKILGSVDFLGNPLGFVSDVSEGVTGLLLEGNVRALLKNVTHGISNSAAKVTESLGDGLERVVSDEAHEETRRRIRSAAPGAHLAAGFRGLGLGILGGMTSLVKHSYEGATQEGLGGFLAGVGKGLVGTVTKPVIGVLDLAAETASAVRDTSRRSDRWVPGRARGPRCVSGGALLPRYCGAQAAGAALLYALNHADYGERFLACRVVRDAPHDIRALLSDEHLRIITCKHAAAAPAVVMETHLSNLVSCTVVSAGGAHFVELGVRGGAGGADGAVRRPRVQCDGPELCAWVCVHAALARQLHYDSLHTLHPHTDL